jgi:hypothetical protein
MEDVELDILNNKECRICYGEENERNPFITPCLCNGTSKYIHMSCLKKWMETTEREYSKTHCMECNFKYKFNNENIYQKEIDYYFFPEMCRNMLLTGVMKIGLIIFFFFLIYIIDFTANDMIFLDLIYYNNGTAMKARILNSSFTDFQFYKSASILVINTLFVVYHIIYIKQEIYDKKQYLNHMFFTMLFYIYFSTHMITIYNTVDLENKLKRDTGLFINDILDILNFFMWDLIVNIHENVVILMNSKQIKLEVLNINDIERGILYEAIRDSE